MTDKDFCRLLTEARETPELMELIAAACEDELALQTRLRRTYSDELVRTAMTLHFLRQRASSKFSRASEMWFDRVGLEQATAEVVARHKARRFHGQVDDLCCGIGGDAIALAEHCRVVAADARASACLMTRWNCELYGVARQVSTRVADVEADPGHAPLVHIDPDRRSGARRSVRIEDYRPSLPFLLDIMQSRVGGAIKLSPASNFGGKFPECELELISVDGECKEATAWFGSLAGEQPARATVLPSGETSAADPMSARAAVGPCREFVFDPDPAVVRSGLLDVVAVRLGLDRLDHEEEYLTGDKPAASDFVQSFRLLAELPNNDRQLRRYFREHPFGQVEIKARHVPIDVDAVRRKLPLNGKDPVVLIFARVANRTRALVCERQPRRNRLEI